MNNFNHFIFSALLTSITTLLLGLFVLSKNRGKDNYYFIFALYSFSIALWSFCVSKFTSDFQDPTLVWGRLLHLGAILIPVFFVHFIQKFLNQNNKKLLVFVYSIGTCFIILNLFTRNFIQGVTHESLYSYPTPGITYHFFFIFFALCVSYSIFKLFEAYKYSPSNRRNQLKYLLFGSFLGYLGGLKNFIIVYNLKPFLIYPYGTYAIPIYVAIVTYAIIRFRLLDINIAFTRAGIFLVVYAFVLGIPFIVLSRTGSGMLATSLAVIVATAGPIIYRFLQRKAEAIVLAKQRNYQRILLQAATTMVTEHDLLKLSRLIVYILKRTINLKFTAIFVKDTRTKTYPMMAMRGAIKAEVRDTTFNEDHPFIKYLKENHEPFFSEEMPPQIKKSLNLPLEIRIVLPAFAGDELLAFVLLGDKVSTESYTPEDIDVFKILSRQATLAIQNCVFFEESKESQERMFSAEKLASIGGMADGLAHQIKNRLNQFSLAGGELKLEIEDFVAKHDKLISGDPELDKTFKYLKDISVSLLENVKRTDGVIKGILDFAKVEKKENFFAPFSLKEVADLSTNLLMVKHETASIPISVKTDNDDAVFGVKSQLTEVIYNLLDNAYEAIKEKKTMLKDTKSQDFTSAIELTLTHKNGYNEIKISDNGIGIKDEDKHKIFAPFFTTKTSYKSGSGIGVYVVKRIVEENHKGKIKFNSTYMKGTEFIIELPKN